ncbi:Williams-Beuren syndrome chromosomal region 16 protein-like [Acipenser ruthenus]|uniref:Williams-Beuren syndrome chromosomal region 16 protein-like n=1 Tax=Acipenser ruthenus TaxID=7906 RepID=A0A444UY77_ACIRT|nr:Williams-Beuren syndrome chromosomal region 16 protein-like [Acipenser ruthenus]
MALFVPRLRPCVRLDVPLGRWGSTAPERGVGRPVYQYVGERAQRKERVFVWGFSYTGALGIPSFVVPDSGRKKPN